MTPAAGYAGRMTAEILHLAAASGSTASVAPGRGFNCFRFAAALPGRDAPAEVLASGPDFPAGGKPSHSGIPLLFPFPNRVKAGEYVVDQQESHLMPLGEGDGEVHADGAGNAIHGFVFDRPWRVTGSSEAAATGAFTLSADAPDRADLWPSDFTLTATYTLEAATLRCELSVENVGGEPLPFGLGTHPYFALPPGGAGTAADCRVTVPAAGRWELVKGVPTGEVVDAEGDYDLRGGPRFGELELDDVYTRVTAEGGVVTSTVENPAAGVRVVQRCDAAFREQVVFTPPWYREGDPDAPTKGAVCIEPYTCTTDAINLHSRGVDAGLRTLAPGESFKTWFEIAAEAA